ncbi:MAG: 50S ribosomal protein L22 [Verrucomicrobiales bacterium]|nr:50S ribosomal protein L22 [Verrucomicrobiales bacterium]
MDVTSTYKFARVSAQKARDLTREIQGLPVSAALDILNFTPRKSAHLIGKTMRAALADAENNFELALDALYVKEAQVNEGPTFKRWKARARGSASPIRKRTSHIVITLSDDEVPEKPEGKKHVSPEKTVNKKAASKKKSAKKAAAKKKSAKKKAAAEKGEE